MIFLPHVLLYTEANVLSSILSVITSLILVISIFKRVDWKNMLWPLLGCTVTTVISVLFVKSQKGGLLTMLLGIALIGLSVYFFFFAGKIKIKPTWYAGLIAGLLSGILGGMFSMSGPPAVISFLQSENDSEDYLATISAYFVISGAVSIGTKAAAGFVTINVVWGVLIGAVGMIIGSLVGRFARKGINPIMLKRAVYLVMAISGVINVITAAL